MARVRYLDDGRYFVIADASGKALTPPLACSNDPHFPLVWEDLFNGIRVEPDTRSAKQLLAERREHGS